MARALSESLQKIERANKHIADIEARIRALPDSYVATIETNPKAGNEVIKHDLRDANTATNLALMIGDAIHNLKCALDYAWLGTIKRFVPSAVSKFTKFPVYPTGGELENALKGLKIDTACPKLFELMVCEIRPYDGGNDAIWFVHNLDILDKHKLLIPVVSFAAIEGIELENDRGETARGGTWSTEQVPPYFVPIENGWHIRNKGKVTVHVDFDRAATTLGLPVVGTLSSYSRVILKVVEHLERL
jgi:hypothetical protein